MRNRFIYQAARMLYAALQIQDANVYGIGIPAASGGVAATAVISGGSVFSVTMTSTGAGYTGGSTLTAYIVTGTGTDEGLNVAAYNVSTSLGATGYTGKLVTRRATALGLAPLHAGRSAAIARYSSTQIRRLMHTTIALPSRAASRFSKCSTRSRAMSLPVCLSSMMSAWPPVM